MNLPLTIARRYFFSRRSGGSFNLISVISWISLLGYIVGAAALLIVLSVFNGFEGLFISMYNKFDADIRISAAKGKVFEVKSANLPMISNTEGVWAISQVLEDNVLLKYGERQNLAVLKGVDSLYKQVTDLDSAVVAGVPLLQSGGQDFALVGQGVAYQLSVDPQDVFYRLNVYLPKRGVTDALNPEDAFVHAAIAPSGIFSVQEEVDNKYVIVPLRFVQTLFGRSDQVSSIDIRLKPGTDPEKIKEILASMLGERFVVQGRFEQREGFFKIMKSEKAVSYLILLFILFVAASNTIGSLYIMVIEKKRDLRVLSGLGLNKRQAASIFRYEGLLMATVGGSLGIILAIGMCWAQERFGIVKIEGAESFTLDHYPVKLKLTDVALVGATVLALGALTSLYPARKAQESFA